MDIDRGNAWGDDERYQQLVELAPDAILVHDGGRIVLANASAVRLAGAKRRGDFIGMPIETFLDPPYLKSVEAQLTRSSSEREQAPAVRDTLHRLDGSDLEVEIRTVAFMDRGKPSAHLIIRDISDRVAAEQAATLIAERMQRAQKMESVGALAGGVAHEVNNMMQVVLGFSEIMLTDSRIPEERQADLREIVRAAESASSITRQLLTFSRRAPNHPRVGDLSAAVHDSEMVIRRLLGPDLQLVIKSEGEPHAWIDSGQFLQVIVNLAVNARDALRHGGTLTIATCVSELAAGSFAWDGARIPAGRYATLEVSDDGAGMDAATQARIFEPFFTTKPLGQGTGLGLASVIGVIGQNKGFVTVRSAPDCGATFTLHLPLLPAEKSGSRTWTSPPINVRTPVVGATILVVDDEPSVRAITSVMLERSGYRVIQAGSGTDALRLVELHGRPDLVITDLLMPGMGGADLVEKLQERWATLPVVFMSGFSSHELDRQGLLSAEIGMIQKPFTMNDLVSTVASLLAKV